ncbi:MAG: ATP synthase F1 subunit gamma [Ferruginibacter sp.]|nr:ATP synthase F1 subunit gamma [Cytophagales bacterium]
MASLKEVKGRITSVTSTQQITRAMKMVAASKLRRAQDNITQMRPYAQKLSAILSNISATNDDASQNPFAKVRAVNRVLLIVITSDRGLCGAFNSNVIRATNVLMEENYPALVGRGDVHILSIGRKGYENFSRRGFTVLGDHTGAFTALSFAKVRLAAEEAMQAFLEGRYDRVDIVYNEFKNVATQILRREQFLPIQEIKKDEEAKNPTPGAAAGNAQRSAIQRTAAPQDDYIFEPSKERIFSELVPNTLKVQLYKAVLESNAAEHGARMTTMDKATDNAGELLKQLKLVYNRTRQAAITKEILEIVGGAEALAN